MVRKIGELRDRNFDQRHREWRRDNGFVSGTSKEMDFSQLKVWARAQYRVVVKTFTVTVAIGCALVSLSPRARAGEEVPSVDRRATELRHLDLAYAFEAPETKDEWAVRAAYLRRHILSSAGLWPEPPKGPLDAHLFGRVDRGDHTVEKVYFESLPGFYVTGNLYRPKKTQGKLPGLLNPHGHWDWGRLEQGVDASHPVRAQSFAKLGFVTFSYDMVSYGDAVTFGESRGIAGHQSLGWGNRESLWGLSLMGLQLWNSLRAVDFLLSLPDVDPNRIGITGESGGGTQTFLLTAVDDRITAAAPVNMISAHMQGGCACENAPNLRVDTNNVEIGALAAPRPLLLIAATGDWTKNTLTVEFPAIRSVYRLLGVEPEVAAVLEDAPHNNNRKSREAAYGFFSRQLLDGPNGGPLEEPKGAVTPIEELMVFQGLPRPTNELDARGMVRFWTDMARRQLEAARPHDMASLAAFRDRFGVTLHHALAAEIPRTKELIVSPAVRAEAQGVTEEHLVLSRRGKGDRVELTFWSPPAAADPRSFVMVVSSVPAARTSLVEALLRAGHHVVGVSLFAGRNSPPPADIQFFTTYNRTDTAHRVQDVLTAVAYLRSIDDVGRLSVVGAGRAGLPTLLARALAPPVDALVSDASGFASEDEQEYLQELFVPGVLRAGGFLTAALADTESPLFVHNAGARFDTASIAGAYRALGREANFTSSAEPVSDRALVAWLEKIPNPEGAPEGRAK